MEIWELQLYTDLNDTKMYFYIIINTFAKREDDKEVCIIPIWHECNKRKRAALHFKALSANFHYLQMDTVALPKRDFKTLERYTNAFTPEVTTEN